MNGSKEKKEKTRNQLVDALIRLCEEKSYYNITVQEISDAAGVNKSTFYRYFDTKDELLRYIESFYIEELRDLTPSVTLFLPGSDQENMEDLKDGLVHVLNFHLKYRKFTMFLLSPTGDPVFRKKIEDNLMNTCLDFMKMRGIEITPFQRYGAYFFIEGYYNTLWKWIKEQDCSAEEFAGYLIIYFSRVKFTPYIEK
ncbi:MAG: TetR/AcrR family transcriptional regulator [Bilifractor sp.]|jgi:AcrR family transcriptional regulator